MTTYFTSDFHIGHINILKYCPNRNFPNIDAMNEGLIANFNTLVRKEDTVYFLGDFSLSEKYVPIFLPQMNGNKILVPGNHDACFPRSKKQEGAKERYLSYGFADIQTRMHVRVCEREVLLCHFPYSKDSRHGERYSEHLAKDKGLWLLHGHCHGRNKISGIRQIDCGVDAWGCYPASEQEINRLIKTEEAKRN